MLLGRIPHALLAAIGRLGEDLGVAVRAEAHAPVEHFYQEGKLLQDARVKVCGEAARVGRREAQAAAAGAVLGRVLVALPAKQEMAELVRAPGRFLVGERLVSIPWFEKRVVLPARKEHGQEEHSDGKLDRGATTRDSESATELQTMNTGRRSQQNAMRCQIAQTRRGNCRIGLGFFWWNLVTYNGLDKVGHWNSMRRLPSSLGRIVENLRSGHDEKQ